MGMGDRSRWQRLGCLLVALVSCLVLGAQGAWGQAEAAATSGPERVWLTDTPNDSGKQLTVHWTDGAPAAEGATVQVLLGAKAEGPFYPVGAAVPANGAWFMDLEGAYGWQTPDDESGGHAVVVSPLEIDKFSPSQLVKLVLAAGHNGSKGQELAAELGDGFFDAIKSVLADWKVVDEAGLSGHVAAGVNTDVGYLVVTRPWYAKLTLTDGGGKSVEFAAEQPMEPAQNLFDMRKANNFSIMVIMGFVVLAFIFWARRNPNLYLRRLAGLDAVEEALGRATEMGKPVLYVHGLHPMDSVSTIAAVNILGEVGKRVARYDSGLLVANYDPIVLAVSQETVREAYTHAGRPDAFNEDDVFYAASEQFAYTAAVDGIMMRQKPAANFFCGYFYAESLLLAETGAATGAIQIAATDSFTQLPFFVTTCDYTIMGEELYAASAYLSRDPMLVGSLKGQDWGKVLILAVLVVGTLVASFTDATWVQTLIKVY